ncbi:MAG: hypothetical protein K0S65_4024 [Labilithrix sp.]|nr:hypothetical protein [Labilithrix sp.]
MKLRLALGVATLAIAVACAGRGSDASDDVDRPLPVPEAGVPDPGATDAGPEVDAALGPLCSRDGWCTAEVPDPPPVFEDLWPLATTAFAVGNGIFEFDGTRWVFAHERVAELTAVWAASPDEVWAGGRYGRIVHGVRTAGTWQWTQENIGDKDTVLSLWGADGTDLYAVTEKRAYHHASAPDGSAQWRVEVEDEAIPDPYNTNRLRLERVSGSGPNDVWVSGVRGDLCSYLVHKIDGRYELVADCQNVCTEDFTCFTEPLPPALFDRWLTVDVLQPQRATASQGDQIVRIMRSLDGVYDRVTIPTPGLFGLSLWGPTETDLYSAGYAQVRHNPNIEDDGGAFQITSIALTSIPLMAEFKVRGTSPANVWVFGGAYALHKTKP